MLISSIERPKRPPTLHKGLSSATGNPSPAANKVNGAVLLNELTAAIRTYVVLEPGAAEAVALWAVHTHAIDAFSISPRLAITSAVKRCGKTTLLDVLNVLVRAPILTANTTAAGLYHQIDDNSPTLLIDEADTFLAGKGELRGILNSGHRRNSAKVLRGNGWFSTWAPVVIAMIGDLPDTLEDRSIPVRLQRRRADENITQFRSDRSHDLDALSSRSAQWAEDKLQSLTDADPVLPDALQDRVADNWRPLLAIADIAGGKWPKLAREVATTLTLSKRVTEQDPAVMLLEDIYAVTRQTRDQLPSAQLAATLAQLGHRPWAEWKGGQPITAKAIANMLAPFNISPDEMRVGQQILRGYRIAQFEDAFARYVSAARPQPVVPAKTSKPRASRKRKLRGR